MQAFEYVIEVREFAEQINQQLPFCQPDAEREVTRYTHSPIVVPCKRQVKKKVWNSFVEPFTVHWKDRGTSPSGMQLLPEWQLSIRQDVPILSSSRLWQAA